MKSLRYSNLNRASAMVFALIAILVIGVLIAVFQRETSDLMKRVTTSSASSKLQAQADANYDRVMNAVLAAYVWGTSIRRNEIPEDPIYLSESYGAEFDALRDEISGNCGNRVPCTPVNINDFHARVFPAAKARAEGFRYQINPQQNSNFDAQNTDFPKRFQLILFQNDPENPGTELKVSGQFIVGPTSLSNFSTLAFALDPRSVVMGEGDHTMAGYFFKLEDDNGNPFPLPAQNCATDRLVPGDPNSPPVLRDFSIYYYPKPGGSLSAKTVASNIPADRHCFGLFRTHQWGYQWGGQVDTSGVKRIDNILITGAPQQDLETGMRAKAASALGRMPAFTFMTEVHRSWNKDRKILKKQKLDRVPQQNNKSSELLLGVVRLPLMSTIITAAPPRVEGVGDLNERYAPIGDEGGSSVVFGNGYGAHTTDMSGGTWDPIYSTLKIGTCASGDSSDCNIRYSVHYKNAASGQIVEHTIYNGSTNAMNPAWNRELASGAPLLKVVPMDDSQTKLEIGILNLTVFTAGPAVIDRPIVNTDDSVDPHIDPQNPQRGGQTLLVNYGSGPAAKIPATFKTMPYRANPADPNSAWINPTLSEIKNQLVMPPSANSETIRIDAGLVAIGPGQGGGESRPISLDPTLLSGSQPVNPKDIFGTCSFAGPLWARGRNDQLRVMQPSLQSVAAGCEKISTRFLPKWESNPTLNIPTTRILGVTEVGRDYSVEKTRIDSRIAEAREALGL